MRKGNYIPIALLCGLLLGCSGKEAEKASDTNPETEKRTEFVSEDFSESNRDLWKTEKGYYYYSYGQGGFRYVDKETGNNIYLCNKPECRHDGNQFCVATNDAYLVLDGYLYNDRLIVNVMEDTDTRYQYKLLELALDGSVANEIATYCVVEKTSESVSASHTTWAYMCVHRNKVMLTLNLSGEGNLEDAKRSGVAIVDLDTGEVSYLDEEALSTENAEVTNITGYGDYFYYCRAEGKKTILYRYSLRDGSVTPHKLLVGFKGEYAVVDDNHLVYLKSGGRELCAHYYETGENKEEVKLMGIRKYNLPDGGVFEEEMGYNAVDIDTDGEYYYVAEQGYSLVGRESQKGEPEEEKYNRVFVYNKAFELVTCVNLAPIWEEIKPEGEDIIYASHKELKIDGDRIYNVLSGEDTNYVYSCRKSDFLAGAPKFTLEYTIKLYHTNGEE